jgi:hypothetical protein
MELKSSKICFSVGPHSNLEEDADAKTILVKNVCKNVIYLLIFILSTGHYNFAFLHYDFFTKTLTSSVVIVLGAFCGNHGSIVNTCYDVWDSS